MQCWITPYNRKSLYIILMNDSSKVKMRFVQCTLVSLYVIPTFVISPEVLNAANRSYNLTSSLYFFVIWYCKVLFSCSQSSFLFFFFLFICHDIIFRIVMSSQAHALPRRSITYSRRWANSLPRACWTLESLISHSILLSLLHA